MMLFQKKSHACRAMALCLILALSLAFPAFAAQNAARYITGYNGYIYRAGNGVIQVCSSITAPQIVDVIGTAVVSLYECPTNSTNDSDWECIYHFYYNLFPEMVDYDDVTHGSAVTYEGTEGYYYKAQVTVFVEHDGTTEARTFWTNPKMALHYAEDT